MSSFGQAAKTATRVYASVETGAPHTELELLFPDQFSPELRCESEDFLEAQRTSHPFQLPDWGAEENSAYAMVRVRNELRLFARCGLVWPLGRHFGHLQALSVTRGPVCDDADLMRVSLVQLVEMCRSRNFVYVDVNPDLVDSDADKLDAWLRENEWFAAGPQRASLRVDLRWPLEEILGTFRKTTRYEIRRAETAGIEISDTASEDLCQQFLNLYFTMASDKGFAPDPESHIRRVLTSLRQNRRRGVLLTASYKGAVLGGAVVVRVGSSCWYVWGATGKKVEVNVGHLLQWRAMRWAKQQGCTEYDLGGYRDAATDGPALFKRGFSQRLVRFMPTYRYVTNPMAYSAFKVVHGGVKALRAMVPVGARLKHSRVTR
jgi:lipid II:glycine glycyltransferase (peptidoglycan interpeptide bridge formation enzyme)